jgi:hypothetical protein
MDDPRPRSEGERTASRIAALSAWAAFVLAAVASGIVLLAPLGTSVSGGTGRAATVERSPLLRQDPVPALGFTLAATLAAALPVALGRTRVVARARWTSAALLLALCLLASASIGLLYLPSASVMALSALFGRGAP